ncbi:MAG TPA: YbfB/YjiJ family MFS transporter [Burkholderiales bacterium]|nr:YbfB/YjiJ family MFS transporter [Burkholderiales bacterium]
MLWAALGIGLHVGIARFTYGVMLPALKRDLGLDYFGGGALNAVHLLGYLAGTLAAPRLAARLGMAPMSAAAHALAAAGALACALAPTPSEALGPAMLALGRLATGLGAGAGVVAILVIAFGAVPAAARPSVSALVWSSMGVAVVLSGVAAGPLVATAAGWRVAFVVAAALALLLAIGFPPRRARAAAAHEALAPSSPGFALRELLRPRWSYLVGAYFMFGAAYIAYSTFAGTRLEALGAPRAVVSATWIAFGVAMMAGSVATFALLRFEQGRRKLALVAASLAAALGAAVSWSEAPAAMLAGALLVGVGLAATPTIVSAYARERCSGEQYAQAFSFATAVMGVGQLLGPLAAGALADRFGVAAVVLFAFAAYALASLLAALDRHAEARPAAPAAAPSRTS